MSRCPFRARVHAIWTRQAERHSEVGILTATQLAAPGSMGTSPGPCLQRGPHTPTSSQITGYDFRAEYAADGTFSRGLICSHRQHHSWATTNGKALPHKLPQKARFGLEPPSIRLVRPILKVTPQRFNSYWSSDTLPREGSISQQDAEEFLGGPYCSPCPLRPGSSSSLLHGP